MPKKTIAIDFDGVIMQYDGYKDGTAYGDPMPGAFIAIQKLLINFNVYILSARPAHQIEAWLRKWEAPFPYFVIPEDYHGDRHFYTEKDIVGITNRKFPAVAYVDDRAVRFDPVFAHEWENNDFIGGLMALS